MFVARANPGPRLPSFSELMSSIAHRAPFPPQSQNLPYAAQDALDMAKHHQYVLSSRPEGMLHPQVSRYTPPPPMTLKPEPMPSPPTTAPVPVGQMPIQLPTTYELPTPPASADLDMSRDSKSPESEATVTAPKRKHACKTCGRSFTTSGHLARHNRTHTGERKHMCPWPQCWARFARQDNCMQHYKTHMNGKGKRHRVRR